MTGSRVCEKRVLCFFFAGDVQLASVGLHNEGGFEYGARWTEGAATGRPWERAFCCNLRPVLLYL